MTLLAERLEQALKLDSSRSKAGMARACGISKPAVSAWFSGATQSLDGQNLLKAADYLGVTPLWLSSGKGPMSNRAEARITGGFDEWDSNTPLHADDVQLPLYKEVELSAGAGSQHFIEINGRHLRFARSTLQAAGVQLENAACALVSGNSMEPRISDGATIGIDRGRTQIKDGRIYAIDHDGMLRVKYLYRQPGGGLRLHSENHEEHPDESYGAGEVAERIKVLGWVFWVSQMNVW
jgi:phage repressor protein C with HTH and peptisase S24 domain